LGEWDHDINDGQLIGELYPAALEMYNTSKYDGWVLAAKSQIVLNGVEFQECLSNRATGC
jgi:hypothetical protein